MKKKKKRPVTLIEIMIVILLIGLIGGALAFNMRGSMDKGRVFKTEQNKARVYDALMMANAAGEFNLSDHDKEDVVKQVLQDSPFIKDADTALLDGWGTRLVIDLDGDDDLDIYSQRLRDLGQQ